VFLAGCLAPPTTQPTPGVLTPQQQGIITTVQTLQAVGDTANGVIQAAAVLDPALTADAALAQVATTDLDKVVAQVVADVTAGSVDETTLIQQITSDLTTIIPIVGKSPVASAKFHAAMSAKMKH